MRSTSWTRVMALAGTLALGLPALVLKAGAQERPKTSSSIKVPAQGGGGVEPQAGAPPAVEPKTESRPAKATVAPASGRLPAAAAPASSLRAVSLGEAEATVELDGVREVLRPGSRLGGDTVRSVAPDRIVLERPPLPGDSGGPALVIVTFDEAGHGTARVFWPRDPSRPAEVKRP